jgi:PncC family amidohydrolase
MAPARSGGALADPVDPTGRPVDVAALTELAERLQARCLEIGWTVGTAESCTGGLVASAITTVPGSSGYFLGAVVSYADRIKEDVLGVPSAVLAGHGAVSAQVARAMAEGARERLGVDLAVAVTGVAGPDGGSAAKPVGLTYIATAGPGGVDARRYQWAGDRAANQYASAAACLELLIEQAVGAGPVAATEPPPAAG